MYFLEYVLYMNVYTCMYNVYRCCTQNLCQRALVCRLSAALCEPFLPAAECQLVVVEAREGQSFTLEV